MHLLSLFFVFLSIAYRVNCRGKPSSCTGTFVDRYCALDDKEGENECEENLGIHKDVRIADLCFDAMVKNGYKLNTEAKLEKLCNLKSDEYDAFNLCYTTAINLDLKRGGKKYHGVEHCLTKIEKKEDKQCEYSHFKTPTSDKPDKSKIINVKAEKNPWSKIPWNGDPWTKEISFPSW